MAKRMAMEGAAKRANDGRSVILSVPVATRELYRDDDVALFKVTVAGQVMHLLACKAHVNPLFVPVGTRQ